MHIEAELLDGIRRVIARKIGNIARGYSSKEEARVIRIIKDPSSISPEDIEKYRQRRLDPLMPLGINIDPVFSAPVNLGPFFNELDRQKELTPEQLANEVIEDAKGKFKEWKLK